LLLVTILACGKPAATTPNPTGSEAPPSQQPPATGKATPAAWQTVQGKDEGIAYSLQVPADWKWDKDGIADKTSFTCTFTFQVKISNASSKDAADVYAKKRLDSLKVIFSKEKDQFRDQRIIKVGDVDAAWFVIAVNPGDGTPTSKLNTHCLLRAGGRDVELEGERFDVRPERKESDFAESQEEFLKITQSFRVTSAKGAKP
jgi:hypothetical protein